VPAPLETFLRAYTSGANVFTPEMLDHFGGKDALLSALKTFDPNAQAVDSELSGGEGGSGGMGTRFDFDISKAPKSQMGTLGLDLRNSNFGELKNPRAVVDDSAYGKVTNSRNVIKPSDPLWVHLAPLVVGALAPMAGAALAGTGIGGAAGMTAAATGSGLGGASGLPGWATNLIGKAPQFAQQVASGNFNPLSTVASLALGQGASALGINPYLAKTALSLGQLAARRR